MRVGVEGYAVWTQATDGFDCLLDAIKSLQWKTVNQVVVDAGEACGSRVFGHGTNLLFCLNAVHYVLHARVEILNAKTQATKAETRKRLQLLACRRARVCFDGELCVR